MRQKLCKAVMYGVVVLILSCFLGVSAMAGKVKLVNTDSLVSRDLLFHAGLNAGWQVNLPLKEGEKIAHMGVFDGNLFVTTENNILFCLDRQTGLVRYTLTLASPKLPIYNPTQHNGLIWFMVGNKVQVLNPAHGIIEKKLSFPQIGTPFKCGLDKNDRHIFLTGAGNRMYAFDAEEYWLDFMVTADDDSPINSIDATNENILYTTDSGSVVSIEPEKVNMRGKKNWQFDTAGKISAKCVRDNGAVYVGGEDTKLYKLNVQYGKLEWKKPYHTGGKITRQPVVGKTVVYVLPNSEVMYAVNKQTGLPVWEVEKCLGCLCEKGDRAFVLTRPGLLRVMNNATGQEQYSVNFADVEEFVTNILDSSIYVANNDGRVMNVQIPK